jgi:hypothetical protein
MSAAASRTAPWYQFGSADVVFLLLCLVIFPAAKGKMLSDPGLGWHLRNIDAMRAEGGWLTVDPFSQPRDGVQQPWRTNQWLGELPFWLGERWAGLEGIAAVATVILAFTLRCVYTSLLRDGLPWPLAAAWVCFAAVGTNCSWIARPNLFTMFFVFVTARLCEQFHGGRVSWRTMLWLLPLFAIWANTHGGFIAGFIVLGVTLGIETVLTFHPFDAEVRSGARRRWLVLAPLVGGAFLATLVNPYGWSLYPWVFQLLGDSYFMHLHAEWKPTPISEPGGYQFVFLILLLPLVLGLSKRKPSVVELGLAVAWLHFALTGFRYFPLWVLVAVPVMGRASLGIPVIERLFASLPNKDSQGPATGPTLPVGLWTAVIGTLLIAGSSLIEGRYARLLPEMIPTKALDELLKRHEKRPDAVVFHSYDWGGYLTWHGWRTDEPRLLNWIDDRNEVQGKEHVKEYFAVRDAEMGWEEKLDRDRVELIGIEAGAPLAQRLQKRAAGSATGGAVRLFGGEWQWHLLYSDETVTDDKIQGTVILERFIDTSH